jgi:hypothetical protein
MAIRHFELRKEDSMFDRLLASRITAAIGAVAMTVVLALSVAPAQASTTSAPVLTNYVRVQTAKSVQSIAAAPDFTCPSRTFCLFQDPNLTGYNFSFTTDVYNGEWLSVTADPFIFSLPWGSLHNNSDSTVYFFDKQTRTEYCVTPNSSGNPTGPAARMVNARYLYIKYGITTCQYPDPPS